MKVVNIWRIPCLHHWHRSDLSAGQSRICRVNLSVCGNSPRAVVTGLTSHMNSEITRVSGSARLCLYSNRQDFMSSNQAQNVFDFET